MNPAQQGSSSHSAETTNQQIANGPQHTLVTTNQNVVVPQQPTATTEQNGLAQQNLAIAQHNLAASQQNLIAAQRQPRGGRLGKLFPRLLRHEAATVNINLRAERPSSWRDVFQENAPRLIEALRALSAIEARSLYAQVDADLDTAIRLCATTQHILNERVEHTGPSLVIAYAAFENMTSSLANMLERCAARVLQANPSIPIVRLDRSVTAPPVTTSHPRALKRDQCRDLAASMLGDVQTALDNLRRIQADLKRATTDLGDVWRISWPGAPGIREADLFPIAGAVNQLHRLALQLYERQARYCVALYKPAGKHRRILGLF